FEPLHVRAEHDRRPGRPLIPANRYKRHRCLILWRSVGWAAGPDRIPIVIETRSEGKRPAVVSGAVTPPPVRPSAPGGTGGRPPARPRRPHLPRGRNPWRPLTFQTRQ